MKVGSMCDWFEYITFLAGQSRSKNKEWLI